MKLRHLALLFVCSTALLCGKSKGLSKLFQEPGRFMPIHVQDGMTLAIALDDDETFVVPLEENPTTGYQWEVEVDNPKCIEVKDSAFLPAQTPPPPERNNRPGPDGKPPRGDDDHQPMLCGAGGTKLFTIQTKRSGTANLTFRYRRNWEKNTPPDKEFTIVVFITD